MMKRLIDLKLKHILTAHARVFGYPGAERVDPILGYSVIRLSEYPVKCN